MTSIVNELISWAKNNSTMLGENGVQLLERFPEPSSNVPWKASIGLIYRGVLVSYTVWERSSLQTELLVMKAADQKTIVMEDANPASAQRVHIDLDTVTKKLLDGSYIGMEPDRKLAIT